MNTEGYNVTMLPPCNRGRNKRGVCAHKSTKGAKRAKRQHVGGNEPKLRSSTPTFNYTKVL